MKPSVIGPSLSVTGNVISKGEIHIDGEICGDVHCTSLTILENGHIVGGVVAKDIVVEGRVTGAVRGVNVSLKSTSHVEGDIIHTGLAIEQGAFFEGKIRRMEDPIGQSALFSSPSKHQSSDRAAGPAPRRKLRLV
jgi:cytoskeletal protein CcmA (bactofilin family)